MLKFILKNSMHKKSFQVQQASLKKITLPKIRAYKYSGF